MKFADTAAVYKNETTIGDILGRLCPKHSLEPEEIFVTSKLGTWILHVIWRQAVTVTMHFAPQLLTPSNLDLLNVATPVFRPRGHF